MKYLKKFNEDSAGLSKVIKDYLSDIEIALKDVGSAITYQEQTDQIVMYIHVNWDILFSLADIKEEVEHIISLMEYSGHELTSVSFYTKRWHTIYTNEPNRWGVPSSKDFFDIQNYDINEKEVASFELKFSNI